MLKLSKKVEYGLMAILHMDMLDGREIITAREISGRYNIPPELLGKVLQSLARSGLAESVHGARGGYRLCRPLEKLTVGDVFEAVEGPLHLVKCHDDPAHCEQYDVCNIRDPVLRIQERIIGYMCRVSLAEFRRPVKEKEDAMA